MILTAGMATLLMASGCAATKPHPGDHWFGRDKLYHFTASGVIGAGMTAVAENNRYCDSEAPVIGITVAVGVGAGKEWYDVKIKETYWSWKDMVWDVIGGAAGSYAVICK